MLEDEERSHGVDEEINKLKEAMFEKVIPRLLWPLETESKRIEPCLLHSDVWPRNVKPHAETKKVMMFVSCAFWGHHQCNSNTSMVCYDKQCEVYVKKFINMLVILTPWQK